MPLSEFYRLVDGNNESPQNEPTNISYMPNDDFVELVWEKGQIMMQGQSSKAKKTPVSSNFQFHSSKSQERDGLLDIEMGLNQDVDLVPWLTYPIEDYCSDLLPEISGVTVNEPTSQNGFNLVVKEDNYNQIDKGSNSHHGVSLDQSKDSSLTFSRSGALNAKSNGDPIQGQLKVSKQDSNFLNFSHFSRPAVMARASFQNNGLLADLGHSRGSQKAMGFVSNPLASEPRGDTGRKNTTINVGVDATEKSVEPIGASSSICSVNSAERASNDLTKYSKRKAHDMEDFECQSEDVEEESLGVKKAATSRSGTGSKRSRAAEVHNLSERRRRDRINEKMRALQELIPNCNKVDKASMLDEAIEYLKTLQLQVQIMSMGSGLCMPPMMFSSGMHSGHFSPMGMSYGMGIIDMNGGSTPRYHPLPSPPVNSFQGIPGSNLHIYGQGMPLLCPQPPGILRHRGAHLDVPNSMQNSNSHVMSMQFQGANEGLDQPTSVDKKSQLPEVGCSTAVSPRNSNSQPAGNLC